MGTKILTVDDNSEIREAVIEVLSSDYEVLTAENGEQALEILTLNEIDLVILDVDMPITNGWETLRIIRDEDGWPHVHVIMLTVYNHVEEALKAWDIGATLYMTKPFSPNLLRELVDKILGNGQHPYQERVV